MSLDDIAVDSVKRLLAATDRTGSTIRVQGWLRSKRDSKAGI